jgi:hypothetical protein
MVLNFLELKALSYPGDNFVWQFYNEFLFSGSADISDDKDK